MASIKIEDLKLSYINGKEIVSIPDMTIRNGDITGFFGPNHVGKSTLLKTIVKTTKEILIHQGSKIEYHNYSNKLLTVYLPQDYNSSVYPWFSVKKNIRILLEAYDFNKEDIDNKLFRFYKDIGFNSELDFFTEYGFLKDFKGKKKIKKVNELSGGQKQILSILRSIVVSPDLIALDEPFSAIDIFNKGLKFRNDILKYLKNNKITTIIISHDLEEIINFTDTLFIFNYHLKNEIFMGEENSNLNKNEYLPFVDSLNTKYNLNLVL